MHIHTLSYASERTTTTGSDRLATLCFSCVAHFMAESGWQPMMSAAQRRRQRRLRSWWRHEQQSIAAALATSQRHLALRGQKKARAGEGDFELNFTAKIRRHPPPQAAGTVYYPMDVDDVPAAGGSRPDRLLDVSGPQERVLRRTVEQNVERVRGVPVLDAPVPQMVDQAAEVVRFFVSLPVVAEQAIEVPTIILEDPIPQRALLRAPQLAEQFGQTRLCSLLSEPQPPPPQQTPQTQTPSQPQPSQQPQPPHVRRRCACLFLFF